MHASSFSRALAAYNLFLISLFCPAVAFYATYLLELLLHALTYPIRETQLRNAVLSPSLLKNCYVPNQACPRSWLSPFTSSILVSTFANSLLSQSPTFSWCVSGLSFHVYHFGVNFISNPICHHTKPLSHTFQLCLFLLCIVFIKVLPLFQSIRFPLPLLFSRSFDQLN